MLQINSVCRGIVSPDIYAVVIVRPRFLYLDCPGPVTVRAFNVLATAVVVHRPYPVTVTAGKLNCPEGSHGYSPQSQKINS
jgi:hypothetical protein